MKISLHSSGQVVAMISQADIQRFHSVERNHNVERNRHETACRQTQIN